MTHIVKVTILKREKKHEWTIEMMAAQAVGEYELERIQIRAFQFFWVI
jgi:hypothetical protein